jgi:hypothetical protein
VNKSGSLADPMLGSGDRVLEVNGFFVHLSLEQTNAASIFEINGGDNQHALVVCNKAAEVGEDPQTQILAFFRVKLTGKEPVGGNAGDEGVTVIRRRRHDRVVLGHDVKRVHEVNVIAATDPFEKWRVILLLEPIPTHVRNLEIFIGAKADHFAGKKVESFLLAELFALGKEQLKSQTNSKKWFLTTHHIANRLDQTKFTEVLHARIKRADAGQNHAACRLNLPEIARHHCFKTDALESLLHAAQIAHAVVDDRNHGVKRRELLERLEPVFYRLPLVDSTPSTRDSSWVAKSIARAKALKHASMI